MYDFTTEAMNAIKSNLAGLPSFCRLTIYDLLSYCDYALGIISISTLDEVARNDFQVMPSPGRKKEEINSETLRNAFRAIKKAKPDQFIFSMVNQRIVIEMPFVRELYEQFHGKSQGVAAVDATEVARPASLVNTDDLADLKVTLVGEDAMDVAAATFSSNKDINNKQNNNNSKLPDFYQPKLPISSTFFPSKETLSRAVALGFDNADLLTEIQSFIDHNKAIGSAFADYNPIYIKWLSQSSLRQKQTKIIEPRRMNDASSPTAKVPAKRPTEHVKQAWSNSGFNYCEQTGRFNDYSTTGAPRQSEDHVLCAYSDLMDTAY